ncbi:MAG: tetratricopeptide repeat protein [Verrucomicrobia bacterium]|nr:tetratricopeptide repeat protein [Verrucomicrobiota bacterium]
MTENELQPQQKNLWLKGVSAYQLKNYDYAINLIVSVLKQSPEFIDGRKLLRRAEVEKFKGQKKGLFSGGLSMFKGGANSKKEPWDGIAELEDTVLQKDPYSLNANQALYDYAVRAGQHDLAAFALETIREGHPDNTKNMHRLAEHYLIHDQPEKAGDIYRNIIRVDGSDMDAIKGEKDAAAKTSMMRQGWQEEGGFRKAMKSGDEAQQMENMARQGMTEEQMENLLAQFAEEYAKDQTNINVVKKIADIYDRMEKPEQALEWYDYAVKLSPGDVSLQSRAELMRNKVAELQIQITEAEIEASPESPDIEEKRAHIHQIKIERLATVLAESKLKVERHPTDKQYRFELASVLIQMEQYREAIPELQQAKSNPHIRNKALLLLGTCFARLGMNDLAINAYSDAVKELTVFNKEKKELLYELGLVYEKVSRKEDYLNCMKEIYNNDYGYRDVAKRVESSYQ